VSLDDKISVSMGEFRRLPQHFIREADRLAREMMFGWDPAIDLEKIWDGVVENKKGFSFVHHPANNLSRAYMDLSDLACKTRCGLGGLSRNGTWDWQAVFRYEKNDNALREMISGAMDCSCGQKPRSTQILSLYCVNGEYHPRSIFVYSGRIAYITHHHKAKRTSDHESLADRSPYSDPEENDVFRLGRASKFATAPSAFYRNHREACP
jgi:hypothetical protein